MKSWQVDRTDSSSIRSEAFFPGHSPVISAKIVPCESLEIIDLLWTITLVTTAKSQTNVAACWVSRRWPSSLEQPLDVLGLFSGFCSRMLIVCAMR